MIDTRPYRFGALLSPAGATFRFFAPAATSVTLVLRDNGAMRTRTLEPARDGWFSGSDELARSGTHYGFRIDDAETSVPDPASRFQPDGVHGLSELIDPASFVWPERDWHGRPWNEAVIYELHIGSFTPGGTYAAAIERLDDLVDLGITALEIMPLSQWPGTRNWGYDGVLPYAPAERYGRPEDLVRLIDAAHARGLSVFLDVVYNHFGPEGNYLHDYAPVFFTEKYETPWGAAINFGSDDVRAFFIENARWWLEAYRFDGLRLDATQMIFDERTPTVLEELRSTIAAWTPPGRHIALIVENDHNDVTLLDAGYDAQWNDDFHHAVHVLTTGEAGGYYHDYADRPVWMLARTLSTGYAFQGDPSPFRDGALRGAPSAGQPLSKFVNAIQNHDQIGNRARGERLAAIAPVEAVRAAAAILLLSPSRPMLFMGEEWAASTPFLFFCDFEPELARLVTEGRRREFASFAEFADPHARESIPDPSAESTFAQSVLKWDERDAEPHRSMLSHYRTLLALRAVEIVPRIATVTGRDTTMTEVGATGLHATWALDGSTLHLEANLAPAPCPGFTAVAPGRVIYESPAFAAGTAPAWSVRWSLA